MKRKNVNSSSVDMISELPDIVLDIILMFLPTQEAARTSILSRKWRYQWAKLPQLVFDHRVTFKSIECPRDIMIKIYESLLLHQGPILKFTLNNSYIRSCSEIDKMILFLSRNGIQDLTLWVYDIVCHKLPSYIFSCLQLRHLCLYNCEFKAPPNFEGFRKLISLELWGVKFDPVSITSFPLLETLKLVTDTTIDCFSLDAPYLKCLDFNGNIKHICLLNTPLLALLRLSAWNGTSSGESSFDLNKVFGCLPLIQNLQLHYKFLKLLAVSHVPKKLPSVLNNLRNLKLSAISFTAMDDVSSTLCLIRSCPNLQKINFEVFERPNTDVEEPVLEYLGMQDYSEVSLNKLLEVEMRQFLGLRPELEFIRFLLAITPKLETVYIKPASEEIIKSGYKMLIELARWPRASQKAEIIFL